jgi:hypothetical protein
MTGSYGELVAFLKSRVPDFASSPEYQMHKGEVDDLPGVILASFGTYLGRVTREGGDMTTPLNALEAVADWKDDLVQSQLRDELFEAIDNDREAERMLLGQMTGPLREMYEHWKKTQ